MRILMANLAVLNLCIKFGGNLCDIDQVMAQNVNFNMAAAAILDFVGYGL